MQGLFFHASTCTSRPGGPLTPSPSAVGSRCGSTPSTRPSSTSSSMTTSCRMTPAPSCIQRCATSPTNTITRKLSHTHRRTKVERSRICGADLTWRCFQVEAETVEADWLLLFGVWHCGSAKFRADAFGANIVAAAASSYVFLKSSSFMILCAHTATQSCGNLRKVEPAALVTLSSTFRLHPPVFLSLIR